MKKFILFILLFIILFLIYSIYNAEELNKAELDATKIPANSNSFNPIDSLELPLELDNMVIRHSSYSFSYNEENEQANWIAYLLECKELRKNFKRRDDFRPDPKVTTETANNSDYRRSGYDRGHLMPAADNTWDSIAISESFYYSNISPQKPGFNRGIWKKLEEQVREWVCLYDSLYIITGPVLNNIDKYIGENRVGVPNFFYKALLFYKYDNQQSIAFLMPIDSYEGSYFDFAITIDSLEQVIGYDLFYQLEDDIEANIESIINIPFWIKIGN